MRKAWLISLVSPCIAFAGTFDYEYDEWDEYTEESVCEHCGSVISYDDLGEVAVGEERAEEEKIVFPQKKSNKRATAGKSRLKHPREQAESDRPKVVQRRARPQRYESENDTGEQYQYRKKMKREGASTTIGSLSRQDQGKRAKEEATVSKRKEKRPHLSYTEGKSGNQRNLSSQHKQREVRKRPNRQNPPLREEGEQEREGRNSSFLIR